MYQPISTQIGIRAHGTAQLAQGEVLAFKVVWHDKQALLNREYILTYYTDGNAIGMVDAKNGKLFLKKSPCPESVSIKDFFVGGKIFLHSRELTVVEYKDAYTQNKQEQFRETVFAGIPADSIANAGEIISAITDAGDASIQRLKYATLTAREASKFGLTDGPVIGISVVGAMAQETVSALQNSYGLSVGNSSEANSFFKNTPQTATFDSCTCCVIKPHAVAAGNAGKIVSMLQSMGFEISAMGMFEMEQAEAKEFLEVYDGVSPTFKGSVVEMCSGPMIAMEVRCQNAVETLRQAAGPWDVEMAQELRPRTIRAMFGVDNVKNAIHVTDLNEDAASECEYFFYHLSPL